MKNPATGGALNSRSGRSDVAEFTRKTINPQAAVRAPDGYRSPTGGASCTTSLSDSGATCTTIKGPGMPKGFAAETAAAIGLSKSTINRALSRGRLIPADVRDKIRRTHLDNGVYLDRIKKLPPNEQRVLVQQDLATPPKPAAIDPATKQFEALKRTVIAHERAWAAAQVAAREMFAHWLREQDDGATDD